MRTFTSGSFTEKRSHHNCDNRCRRYMPHSRSAPLKSLQFNSTTVSIPHPDKQATHGEDANFATQTSLGVFDGVSAWAAEGINSGSYARNLAKLTSHRLQYHSRKPLHSAVRYATERNTCNGSSTACVVRIQNGCLEGLNVGDSGAIVVRNGKIIFHSQEQSHSLNCPYQLSFENKNDLNCAQEFCLELQKDDMVLLGTDGLWDNLFPNQIEDIVRCHILKWSHSHHCHTRHDADDYIQSRVIEHSLWEQGPLHTVSKSKRKNLVKLALDLAQQACRFSTSKSVVSPFQRKCQEQGYFYRGGKPDDITVIVGIVTETHGNFHESFEVSC